MLSSQAPRPAGNFFCSLPARIAEPFSFYGMALDGMWVLCGRKANRARGVQGMLADQQEKNHVCICVITDVFCFLKLTASKDQSKVFGRVGR